MTDIGKILSTAAKTSAFLGMFALCGCLTSKTPTEEAILSLSLGDFDKAVNYSNEALKVDPNDAYALMVAGIAYDNLGYPNRSRRYYEDVMALPAGSQAAMFGQFKKTQPQELRAIAAQRLNFMEQKERPFAKVDAETGAAVFTQNAGDASVVKVRAGTKLSPKGAESFVIEKRSVKGGLDMLDEGDRNVVQRFLTFIRLRDEKLVTQEEWQIRRSVNLGGLMPYSLQPAGQGLDLPAPEADEIIHRLDALRAALEIRAITPQEHAVEREIILEALLPSKPRALMPPKASPEGVMDGAKMLRRIETLQRMGLITPAEAAAEKKATENLIYARLGMTGGQKANANAAPCIQKCLRQTQTCPQAAPKKAAPVKKKTVKKPAKKKAAPAPQNCVCAAQ